METENNLIPKTFFWMFLGLIGTGIVAWYTYSSGLFLDIIVGEYFPIILLAEIIVVLLFSFLFKKLPATIVAILYFLYSMINGVTTSVIFVLFDLSSIVLLFAVTASLFAGLALYGYKTKKDLSNWKTLLFGTLFACIIISLINIFVGNSTLDIIIDCIVLFIFFGITIYDMNKIRQLQEIDTINQDKLHIYCAMELYLDFINIFLRLLSIFGRRRD